MCTLLMVCVCGVSIEDGLGMGVPVVGGCCFGLIGSVHSHVNGLWLLTSEVMPFLDTLQGAAAYSVAGITTFLGGAE